MDFRSILFRSLKLNPSFTDVDGPPSQIHHQTLIYISNNSTNDTLISPIHDTGSPRPITKTESDQSLLVTLKDIISKWLVAVDVSCDRTVRCEIFI
jgi:hypothetical protein